jgi:hypothetical protein
MENICLKCPQQETSSAALRASLYIKKSDAAEAAMLPTSRTAEQPAQ